MQDNNEVQRAPAAPRREWVTPELRSLGLRGTLVGPINLGIELSYAYPHPREGEPYSHGPS